MIYILYYNFYDFYMKIYPLWSGKNKNMAKKTPAHRVSGSSGLG